MTFLSAIDSGFDGVYI